ncbi:flavin reductase family protein [Rhodococcus sp. HM1]|uniref:flavin reductase family protein n=1 Tax=Rhodococcus sp. HM1 TaxID=2937759 RepID=UPI00200AF7F1|nr:flavin reductase family protein [Rhodococcus sp. HM1]MCK8671552.1 flavin reductase family protein [Rhodococcus sp. HM1]
MAGVCTPVSVITAMDEGRPHGTTVSAFVSLSMTPPLVLVCLDRQSTLLQIIRKSNCFGVNILGRHQSNLATTFAKKGFDKFAQVPWTLHEGSPRLHGDSGWIACEVFQLVDGGDHVIVFGHVLAAITSETPPLTYHNRAFGTHAPLEATS